MNLCCLYLVFVQCFMWLGGFIEIDFYCVPIKSCSQWFSFVMPFLTVFLFFEELITYIYNPQVDYGFWGVSLLLKKDRSSCLKHLIVSFSIMLLNFELWEGVLFVLFLAWQILLCFNLLLLHYCFVSSRVLLSGFVQDDVVQDDFPFSRSYWPYPIGDLLFIQVVDRASFKHK